MGEVLNRQILGAVLSGVDCPGQHGQLTNSLNHLRNVNLPVDKVGHGSVSGSAHIDWFKRESGD